MSRPDISMGPEEVAGFLARCPQMVVGAIDADGWPTGSIAASTYEGETLSLRFDPDDPILAELARDPAVCCVADEHRSYREIRGVIVHGTIGDQHAVAIDRVISFDFGRIP